MDITKEKKKKDPNIITQLNTTNHITQENERKYLQH